MKYVVLVFGLLALAQFARATTQNIQCIGGVSQVDIYITSFLNDSAFAVSREAGWMPTNCLVTDQSPGWKLPGDKPKRLLGEWNTDPGTSSQTTVVGLNDDGKPEVIVVFAKSELGASSKSFTAQVIRPMSFGGPTMTEAKCQSITQH